MIYCEIVKSKRTEYEVIDKILLTRDIHSSKDIIRASRFFNFFSFNTKQLKLRATETQTIRIKSRGNTP